MGKVIISIQVNTGCSLGKQASFLAIQRKSSTRGTFQPEARVSESVLPLQDFQGSYCTSEVWDSEQLLCPFVLALSCAD